MMNCRKNIMLLGIKLVIVSKTSLIAYPSTIKITIILGYNYIFWLLKSIDPVLKKNENYYPKRKKRIYIQ